MPKVVKRPRQRQLFALLAVIAGVVASGIVVFASGAFASQPLVTTAVSAKAVKATALSGPKTVKIANIPRAAAGTASGVPQALPLLSPLGARALAHARANAAATAPKAGVVLPNAPTGPSTPGALAGFNGMSDSGTTCSYFGSGCQPPDHGIAANDSFVLQVVNTSIAVYNTLGTLQAGFPKSLQAFAGVPAPTPAGCDSTHNNQPFIVDPRAIYDPVTGRFAVAFEQLEDAFGVSPGCTFTSRYWVAVSSTSDPRGAWHVYQFNTANLLASPSAADYVQFGFNSQAFFIGGNQFSQAGTAFNGAWTLAIPKATAEAGGSISSISGFGGYTANDGSATRLLDTVQPVASYGDGFGGPATEFLVSSFNESVTENKVVVFAFSNPLSHQSHGPTLSGAVVTLGHAYAQPPLADNYPSCTNCLETIDNRISATPVYMHGNIYAAHDTAVNNGTATNANIHWMVIAPALDQSSVSGCTECGTITAATRVVDDNYFTYSGTTDDWFGVLQPDREGNLFMAYEFGSTSFQDSPSSALIARRATVAPGSSWGGGAVYLKKAANATSNSRWGDYEAGSFASWNSNAVWFATEFAGANHDWATRLAKVDYTNFAQK